MNSCEHCGDQFSARKGQRFCSRQCAGSAPWVGHTPKPRRWGARPPLDREHRRLRAAMVPAAVGSVCPVCRTTVLTAENSDLDHIVPRAQGGKSTRDNCRVICRPCNRRLGARLGGQAVQAKRGSTGETSRRRSATDSPRGSATAAPPTTTPTEPTGPCVSSRQW